MSCTDTVCGTGGWSGPLPGDPDNNAILSAFGVADGIQLSWTLPLTNAYAVSFIKIFRGTTGLFVNAVHIKTEGGDSYLDRIPVNDFQTYFYWIQIVTINGTELDVIGPASAAPINGFYELAARLSGKIDNSFLAGELRDHLDLIDVNSANIAAEVQNRLSENQAFANVLAAVQADVDGAITLVQSEITERSSADSALVDSVNALAVGLDGNAAAIVDEQIARISADGAMATDIQTLFTTVDGVNATIHEVETTKVGYSVLSSTKAIYDGDGVLDVYPALAYPAEDFPEYAINRKRIIDKNGVTAWNALPANASRQVEWVVGLPLASAVKSVVVAGPDGYAGLEQAFLAQQDLNDGFKAMYTAKVDVNGVVGGFGLYNDGQTVDALFDVDNFAVGKSTASIKPFIIDTSGGTPIISLNGQVYIGNRTAEEVATQLAQTQVKSICFQRSVNRPTTPTGGSYISPTPAGWSDGIPAGTLPVWMSTRIFTSDALSPQQAGWTTPEKVGELGAGTKAQFSVNGATSWHDTPSTNDYYMRTGTSTDGGATWTYAGAVKIKGETGAQGNQGIQGIAGTPGADGVTYYTWIKYADTPTTGMSDFPSGKKYLGVAYNKTTPTESSVYADYAWSLIQGDQGIQGPAGVDGQPTYTWIKYADSAAGAEMSDSPTGKTYIGIAPNKTTATESTTAGDYTWALIQGPQGPQGTPGTNGVRGSRSFYVSGQTVWSSTLATTTATVDGGPVLNDVVTQYGTGFSQTRFWNGSAWLTITVAIDGNLLVTGTVAGTALVANSVTADKIDSRGLSIKDASGNVILAAGSAVDWSKLGSASSNLTGLGYTGDLDATYGATLSNIVGLSDLGNLFPDCYFDSSEWAAPNTDWEYAAPTTLLVSKAARWKATKTQATAGTSYLGDRTLPTSLISPCIGGETLYISALFATVATATGTAHLYLRWYDKNKTYLTESQALAFTVPSSSASSFTGKLTVPANASFVGYRFRRGTVANDGTATGWAEYGGIRVSRTEDGATVGAPTGTYVGGTLAQTVESNASTALSTANTAATNATTALAALTDIASDSLLTPGEKPSIIAQRDVIVAEQAGIDTQATAYGITTEKTTYDTAISALTTYLATLTSPVLWSTLTGNTTIVGATFRSKFNDVYVARQVVLNKIAANAKALADAAQTQANTATTNAATAQATANTASTNANTANSLLTDIASDAKLTPSEKHDVRREWDVVINEKAGINTNAGLYAAAASANTTYNTALQTLGTYLNAGAAYTLSTSTPPSWINNASLGTTTTIVGATFRSNWQALYAARQVLLNKIAEEAGKVASWSGVSGTGKPADNATKNTITAATTAPASPTDGDVWVDTNAPVTIKTRVSGAWVASGNVATSLSQVNSTEATKLSGIATGATANIVSSGVFASRPTGANGDFYYSTDTKVLYQKVAGAWVQSATVGATFGVDISGQITPANASTYIANAAIQTAQIADAAITSAKIGNAAIGSAQIGNLVVQAAHIENLTVGTGKIADSAVTDVVLGTWATDSGYVSSYDSPTYTLTLSHAASVLITTQIDYAIFMTGGVSSVKLYVNGSLKRSLTFAEYSAQRSFGISHALNLAAGAHTIFVRVAGASIENRGGYIYALGVKK